jgi:hypothetical protein
MRRTKRSLDDDTNILRDLIRCYGPRGLCEIMADICFNLGPKTRGWNKQYRAVADILRIAGTVEQDGRCSMNHSRRGANLENRT